MSAFSGMDGQATELGGSMKYLALVIVQPNCVKNRVGLGVCARIYDKPSRPTRFRLSPSIR